MFGSLIWFSFGCSKCWAPSLTNKKHTCGIVSYSVWRARFERILLSMDVSLFEHAVGLDQYTLENCIFKFWSVPDNSLCMCFSSSAWAFLREWRYRVVILNVNVLRLGCCILRCGMQSQLNFTNSWLRGNWVLAQACSSKPMSQAIELWLKSASSRAVSQLWACMIWLKSGSSQAMTIAFGVSQFGRFGAVFFCVVSFCFCQRLAAVGFQRWVSVFGFSCCWKRCKSGLDLQES